MTPREEKVWNFIDGLATPEEQKKMEADLKQSEDLRQEMAKSQVLHAALQKMTAEEPSLRFSQNLLENLPNLYGFWKSRPLVANYWEKLFLALFAGAFLLVMGYGISGAQIQYIPFSIPTESLAHPIQGNLPFSVAVIVMSLSGALLCLLWLDRWLGKRFQSAVKS